MKKIEHIGIEAIEYPDWDYTINQLMRLADKLNEIIDVINKENQADKIPLDKTDVV